MADAQKVVKIPTGNATVPEMTPGAILETAIAAAAECSGSMTDAPALYRDPSPILRPDLQTAAARLIETTPAWYRADVAKRLAILTVPGFRSRVRSSARKARLASAPTVAAGIVAASEAADTLAVVNPSEE